MIEIKLQSDTVTPALARLAGGLRDASPLMTSLAGILLDAVQENFLQEGRPAWIGLRPGSWLARAGALTKTGQVSAARFEKRVRDGKILQSSTRLKNSITARSDATSAVVGTNVKYAAIHQFGGQTGPHEIRPRYKKALAWATGRNPVKVVHHPGSKIPARPFLALTAADEAKIVGKVNDYLRSLIAP